MARGRKSAEDELAREGPEGRLAMLGNARVYARLIRNRVKAAMLVGSTGMLHQAIDDLDTLDRLLVQTQEELKKEA